MATINNTLSNTLLSGTGGKDTINNGDYLSDIYSGTRKEGGDSVTMAGGAGNDHISNCYGYNVSITGDAGKDEIYNYYGDDATIAGGAGKDYIANGVSDDISLSGGADNDTIFNLNGDRATIDGGEGNDSIENTYGNSVSIDGGAGNDYIGNSYGLGYEGLKVTINGGEGNDTISNGSDKVSINGGDGDDSIYNSGADVTIDTGAGNDSISLNSTGNLIQYKSGDGSDTIWGFNESDTLTITGSSYSTQVSGDDVIVTVGKDKILLVGAKGKSLNINKKGTAKLITLTEKKDGYRFSNRLEGVKIDALGGNDNIVNYYSNVTIDGGAGNDWIENYWGDSVALDGGTGNDYINNYAANVTINGGNGNDNIDNSYEGDSVTIDGGAGKDSIYNDGSSVTIDGGTGNDYIRNEGGHNVSINGGAGSDNIVIGGLYYALSQVTITGGAGHDSINLQSSGNLIEYTAGDGNDTIWGFNESDTLTITGGSYSTEVSGDDVIVTVGEGQILLVGAKGKSLNINKESTTKIITLTENADTYSNSFKGVKIDALGGKDYIYNFGDKVTIDSGTGYQNVITNRDGDSVSISGGAGDDNIYNYANSKVTINAGKGNDFIRFWSTGNLVQYNAGDGNDTIWGFNESDTLTITGGSYSTQVSGDDVIVKVGKDSVLLKNAKDKSLNINKEGTTKLITYDTGQETFYNLFKGVTISVRNHSDYGNYINHSIYNYGDKVTISGSERREGISNYGSNVKINTGASDDYVYNYASKVTIDFGDDADTFYNDKGSNLSINGGAGCDRIYNGGENYNGGDNVTINGGKGNDFISLGSDALNNLIQYKSGDGKDKIYGFDENDTLSISGGEYSTAKSGADIIVTVGDGEIKLFDAASLSAVNIIDAKTSANSWKLSGTMATYGTSSKTLVKVTGVKSLDGLSLSGKIVTVAASALNKSKVTISNGYTLELADDVATPKTKKATWAYKSGTATFKSSYKTAGYSLANNGKSISYLKATTAEGLATINGAKSKSFTVSGNKITLKNSALKNKVTVGGGYDFNFASDYKNATITGSANDDTITTNGNNLSVNGGEGDDTLKIFGTGTTVTGGDGSDVFIFKAGNNVIADYSEEDLISLAGAAQVSTSGDDVIFSVGNGKVTVTGGADKTISYTDASGKQTYSASSSAVSINGKTIVLLEDYTEDSFNVADYGEKLQTIDASAVQLDLEIIGNKLRNSIKGGENNETLIGGKGNDTLTGGEGSDVFIYNSGDGNDLITDYNEDDIINFASGTASVTKKNKDVIFKVGSGKITVAGAASKTVTYVDANGKMNYYPAPTKDSIIINGTSVTVLEEYKSATFDVGNVKNGSKVKRIDASPVSHDLEIVGNAKANVILGGAGDDTIYGGKSNDTLQGGDGADTFVYETGDGKDSIVDYEEEDTIQIKSGKVKSKKKSGNDVIFTIGSGNITVAGAANKTISYIEGGKTKTYDGSASNVLEDDNFISGNDLSSLIQSKAIDCFFANVETSLNSAKALPSVTYSSKK